MALWLSSLTLAIVGACYNYSRFFQNDCRIWLKTIFFWCVFYIMHRAVLLTSSHIFFPLSEIPVISAKKKPPESIAEYQEKNLKGLIEPPLPFFKNVSSNSAKQNVLANVFSSRGARLLNMSKLQKISSSPGSSCINQDSPTTSSSRFVNVDISIFWSSKIM